MGCASAATAGGGVSGGSDGGGIDRTGKPFVAGVKLDNNTAGGGGIDRTGKPFVAGVELDNDTVGGLDRASATTFSEPGVCLRSVVNSEMYARCRCWRADCGGVTWLVICEELELPTL